MKLKGVEYEDFLQYKHPSMYLIAPYCTFKCDKDAGKTVCQNSHLAKSKIIDVDMFQMINAYLHNPITKSVVIGGLEPFDSYEELLRFVKTFRDVSDDTIVIYSGYNEDEIQEQIKQLSDFANIIVKFGRFIPGQSAIYDELLGVILASDNQYAKEISK